MEKKEGRSQRWIRSDQRFLLNKKRTNWRKKGKINVDEGEMEPHRNNSIGALQHLFLPMTAFFIWTHMTQRKLQEWKVNTWTARCDYGSVQNVASLPVYRDRDRMYLSLSLKLSVKTEDQTCLFHFELKKYLEKQSYFLQRKNIWTTSILSFFNYTNSILSGGGIMMHLLGTGS